MSESWSRQGLAGDGPRVPRCNVGLRRCTQTGLSLGLAPSRPVLALLHSFGHSADT